MKSICEIYDISKDFEMPTGTVLIIVSDIEKDKIISILLNTKLKEDMVFNNTEWQEYLEFNGFVYKTQGNVNLVFFKPSLFFEMSLNFFAHFNSYYCLVIGKGAASRRSRSFQAETATFLAAVCGSLTAACENRATSVTATNSCGTYSCT